MRIIRGTFIIMALLAATANVFAHHSFAPFDMNGQKTLVGTIKQFDWTNPHTWIWIDVPNEKGGTDTWGVEGMSPNFLARRGWSKTSFKPGDKATIVVRPMKDGSPGGMFVTATLSNGRKLTSGGAEPAAN
jgi:Family of unknown function (DUF6152)